MKEKILVALAQVVFILALVSFLLPVQAQITQPGTPAGAIAYFNSATCPSGWAEFTTARGLYIVGRQSGGTLATAVGTALTDLENRAAGIHTHTATTTVNLNDPGHTHDILTVNAGGGALNYIPFTTTASTRILTSGFTSTTTTGITVTSSPTTVNNSSGVAGTNAPFIQLLVCQKS